MRYFPLFTAIGIWFFATACEDSQWQVYDRLKVDRPASYNSLAVTWVGTTMVVVNDGTHAIMFDPLVTRPTKWQLLTEQIASDPANTKRWVDYFPFPKPGQIFVNHTHYDHALDATNFAKQLKADLYGPENLRMIGLGDHVRSDKLHVIKDGDEFRYGDFKITVIETCHGPHVMGYTLATGKLEEQLNPPARATEYLMGENFAFLIDHPEGTIIHKSGLCFSEDNFKDVRADVLMLGVSGHTAPKEVLAHIIEPVEPTKIIPMHFDDFTVPVEKNMEFLYLSQLPGIVQEVENAMPNVTIETLQYNVPTKVWPHVE